MPEYTSLVLLKAITEAQIEAIGMQAENMQRQAIGASMAYTEESFCEVRNRLNAVWEDCRP